jgi:hypothetical protein
MTLPTILSPREIALPVAEVIFSGVRGPDGPPPSGACCGDCDEVVYLASPYTHADPAVMEWRYRAAVAAAAYLMQQGAVVFSPIAHSHAIGAVLGKQAGGNLDPNTHAFWMRQDLPMLRRADRLVVLTAPGFAESRGVSDEVEFALANDIPIDFMGIDEAGFDEPRPEAPPLYGGIADRAAAGKDADRWEFAEAPVHPAWDAFEIQTFGPLDPVKDTNPKDGIGATKLPLSLVPPTAIALASLAHLDGALKYGKWNWRIAGVRASIYLDALMRHVEKWAHGEDADPDSGLPHLAHALACMNILVDAQAAGKLHDDRAPAIDLDSLFARLTPHVERLKAKHAHRSPRHYSIEDTPCNK